MRTLVYATHGYISPILRVQAHIRVVEFSKQLLKSGVIPIEPGDSAMPQSTASHSHEDDDETQDSTSEEWMSAC